LRLADSSDTDYPNQPEMPGVLTTERVVNKTDDFYTLTTDWCVEPKRHPHLTPKLGGKQSVPKYGSNIPKVRRLVKSENGASSHWEDVGLDWIKRRRRSVINCGGGPSGSRGPRIPTSETRFFVQPSEATQHISNSDLRGLNVGRIPQVIDGKVVIQRMNTDKPDIDSLLCAKYRLLSDDMGMKRLLTRPVHRQQGSDSKYLIGHSGLIDTLVPNSGALQDEFVSAQNKPLEVKRDWGDSGMAWIKRYNVLRDASDGWDDTVMGWMKRDGMPKRWDDSGMAWIKRNQKNLSVYDQDMYPDRTWNERDDVKRNWDDSGMAWIKKSDGKRNWDDSGMAWIKRDNKNGKGDNNEKIWSKEGDGKRNWDDSGMAWIKRNTKRDWDDAGMAWIKRNDDKRNWDDAGMAWIKRSDNKRNWDDSGMAWIKRRYTR